MAKRMRRNRAVEDAVTKAINAIDEALGGVAGSLPSSGLRNAIAR